MPDGGEAQAGTRASGGEAPTAEALETAYRRDTLRTIRQRLRVAMLVFLVVVGLVVGVEPVFHPERGTTLLNNYALELAVCALGLAGSFWRAAERHMRTLAVVVCAS